MIFIILASAVILGEPVEIINSDCVKVERIQPAAPHRPRPVITKYRPKHLFKHEPKPVIEDCDEGPRLPPLAGIIPEPNSEFTPIPVVTLDVPMPVVPGSDVPTECECFGGGALVGYVAPVFGGVALIPYGPIAPASEPTSLALSLVGLGLLIAGRRTAAPKRIGQMTQRYLEVL